MKRGFTLVELLAVLTILAIVALIAIPMTINIINDSREAAAKRSIENYMTAVNLAIANHNTKEDNEVDNISCSIRKDGNLDCGGIIVKVDVKNAKPTGGIVVIKDYEVFNYYGVVMGSKTYNIDANVTLAAATDVETYKAIVYLDPTNIGATCNAELAALNVNEYGKYTGVKSGCMKFYIYDDSGDTYKMILDHNTSGNVAWNSTGDTSNGMGEVLSQLRADTAGWLGDPRLITMDEIVSITGITISNYSYEYQFSRRSYWLGNNTNGTTSQQDYYSYPTANGTETGRIYGFWTSTPYEDGNWGAWIVGTGWIYAEDTPNRNCSGVRPVITLAKELIGELPEPVERGVNYKGYKGIAYLDPTNLSTTCTKSMVASNVNEFGTPTGIKSGCMKFYVYDDSGNNYTMILDHNTTRAVEWLTEDDFLNAGGSQSDWENGASNGKTPITVNAQLASDTTGWSGNPRLITADEVAHIVGIDASLGFNSSTNSASDWFHFDGEGSTYNDWQYGPFVSYPDLSSYAWLFDNTYYCEEYGCSIEDDYENEEYNEEEDYSVYVTIQGYWTSSLAYSDWNNAYYSAWMVSAFGNLAVYGMEANYAFGVRPVITLPKSSVTLVP